MKHLAVFILALVVCPVLRAQVDEALPEGRTIETAEITPDEEIRERLEGIFDGIGGLAGVEVAVDAGVVTLSGEVAETRDSTDAEALTKATEGVVYVRNRIIRSDKVATRLDPAVEKTRELFRAFLRKLPLLVVALVVVVLFWLVGRWLGRYAGSASRLGVSELGTLLLQRLLRLGFVLLGLVLALEILDATALAGAFLGVAGVVGIAFGFAFRNIVENYLAGILLSLRNPFGTGDHIAVDGHEGKVIRLTARDTVLMTLDGNHLRLPNRKVMDSVLVNFSRNPLRRFDFAVGISVEQDLVAVREFGLETLGRIEGILKDPAPWVVVEELGDSTVNMRFFAWIDQNDADIRKAKSEAIRLVKEHFDEVGIEMPEPIYRVHLLEKPPAGEAAQPDRPPPPRRRQEDGLDTSVDHTIESQIARVEEGTSEEDLLRE